MRSTLAAMMVLGGLFAGCSSRDHADRSKADSHDRTTHDRYANDGTTYDRHTPQGNNDRYGPPVTRNERDDWNRLHSDPVCGMSVNPKESTREVVDGTTYYFDTEDCRRRFHDNPHAYLPTYYDDHRAPDDRRPRDVR